MLSYTSNSLKSECSSLFNNGLEIYAFTSPKLFYVEINITYSYLIFFDFSFGFFFVIVKEGERDRLRS